MAKKILLFIIILAFVGCTNKVDKLFNKAQILEQNGKYLEAINILDKVIELKPDFLGAYINRGADYAELGMYKKAIENYKQVIKLDPKNQLALFNIANNYQYKFNDYYEAIKYYDKALMFKKLNKLSIKINNTDIQIQQFEIPENQIYFERGNAFYNIKQFENALFDFKLSFKEQQDNPESTYMIGASLHMLGRKNEACIEFKKAKNLGFELAKSEYKINCE